MRSKYILEELIQRYPKLKPVKAPVFNAAEAIIETYKNGGKVLVCGNGGSCSDADHIVCELMKSFEDRPPINNNLHKKLIEQNNENGKFLAENLQQGLPAISLCAHQALISAISNDIHGDLIYAQQVVGLGNKGDIIIGLSTSGNSKNVFNALLTAKAKGLKTIGMTGETGGEIKSFCDILINVPETRTAFVQELHAPVYQRFVGGEKEFFDF